VLHSVPFAALDQLVLLDEAHTWQLFDPLAVSSGYTILLIKHLLIHAFAASQKPPVHVVPTALLFWTNDPLLQVYVVHSVSEGWLLLTFTAAYPPDPLH